MLHQRTRPLPDAEPFHSTSHVADIPHVSPKTIAHWAKDHLPHQRTLGSHHRHPEQATRQLAASLAEGVRVS
jgi:hypothetical protein